MSSFETSGYASSIHLDIRISGYHLDIKTLAKFYWVRFKGSYAILWMSDDLCETSPEIAKIIGHSQNRVRTFKSYQVYLRADPISRRFCILICILWSRTENGIHNAVWGRCEKFFSKNRGNLFFCSGVLHFVRSLLRPWLRWGHTSLFLQNVLTNLPAIVDFNLKEAINISKTSFTYTYQRLSPAERAISKQPKLSVTNH